MTKREHEIFGQLCQGITNPEIRKRIHAVMKHGEKKYAGKPLDTALVQLTRASDRKYFSKYTHTNPSGLPQIDHALARTMLAMVVLIQEIEDEQGTNTKKNSRAIRQA